MTQARLETVKVVNEEKEILVGQNLDLKKEISALKLEGELMKTQVERFHIQVQTLESELEAERRLIAKMKACSGDLFRLEEEISFLKGRNEEMARQVEATVAAMAEE